MRCKMKPLTRAIALLFILLFIVGFSRPGYAQGENNHWCFSGSLIRFQPNGPKFIRGVDTDTEEGSASVSDAQGNLLFYTDGSTIFNRNDQPMPNGQGLGVVYQYSATQGALIVKAPGSDKRYYMFRVGSYGGPPEPLIYVEVDMNLNNGLGGIVGSRHNISPTTLLSEKLTGIVHSNGRDTWVVVHGYDDATFYAYLVSPAGVSATPVKTVVGVGNRINGYTLYSGYMRASSNSRKLVQAIGSSSRGGVLELLDFDAVTGTPSNPVVLDELYAAYGVEFSANGSKLYATDQYSIYQFDLLASSAADMRASKVKVGQPVFPNSSSPGGAWALQRGPDDKIYIAQKYSYVGIIESPNIRGPACGYKQEGLEAFNIYGLPNFPNQTLNENTVLARISAQNVCLGELAYFSGSTSRMVATNAVYQWDFGDPASGSANTAAGEAPSHRFGAAGTYLVQLRIILPDRPPLYTTTIITVAPVPTVSLGAPRQTLCPGNTRVLRALVTPAADLTYRWQDGSTAAQYAVTMPGTYWVEATSSQGCSSRSTVIVEAGTIPRFRLGSDTTLCRVETIRLRPQGLAATTASSYLWQDGSTTASYLATEPGIYWLEVRDNAGCSFRDSLLIAAKPCVVFIPNIITPNGDSRNECFELVGLLPAEWSLALYDRWGKLVYETASYDNKWNAAGQASGVYFYHLRNRTTVATYKGWVQVNR